MAKGKSLSALDVFSVFKKRDGKEGCQWHPVGWKHDPKIIRKTKRE
jgi:hypothetical protein